MARETNLNGVLFETDAETPDLALSKAPVSTAGDEEWDTVYIWHIIIYYPMVVVAALYGGYLFFVSAKWQTDVFAFILYVASVLGVTAGAHRLWSHRSFKAKWPLQFILMILQTLALQYSALNWARDHRMHHKYADTDADPHNATRGFFFSHVGWLMVEKHPEFDRKVQGLDLSDLEANPILSFQRKYYVILATLIGLVLPVVIPVYIWQETWTNAILVTIFLRLTCSVNFTSLINSAAHKWGYKPYEKNIRATEALPLSFFALGEGFHNYHHAFPWDYKAGEFGGGVFNFTATFIDLFARIGWAYDLKTITDDVIRKRVLRTGDGSHHLWGWGDKDQSKEEVNAAVTINSKCD